MFKQRERVERESERVSECVRVNEREREGEVEEEGGWTGYVGV